MTLKKLTAILALAAGTLLQASFAAAGVAVSPDDRNLQYTGRVDVSNPRAPVITWPATQVAGNFTGTSLAVTLDDEKGQNYFNVFLDGEGSAPLILQADKGSKTYVLASGLAPGRHSFL